MEIVVRQISGLGNQLFQYAAGLYFSKQLDAQMRMSLDPPHMAVSHGHPRPYLLSHFCISAPSETETAQEHFLLSRKPLLRPVIAALGLVTGTQVYAEPAAQRYTFVSKLPLRPGVKTLYLAGYWQSWEMVAHVAEELRAELSFRQPAEGKNADTLRQIRNAADPVSMHIRRGDYTLAAEGNIALPLDYYVGAINHFCERLAKPVFFVFSDDIEWAREHLPAGIEAVFVDHNDSFTSHEDLRLMSACRHHIIANSTFSWWGAWMNRRRDKTVYAPRYWHLKPDSYYPGLMPPEWILAPV